MLAHPLTFSKELRLCPGAARPGESLGTTGIRKKKMGKKAMSGERAKRKVLAARTSQMLFPCIKGVCCARSDGPATQRSSFAGSERRSVGESGPTHPPLGDLHKGSGALGARADGLDEARLQPPQVRARVLRVRLAPWWHLSKWWLIPCPMKTKKKTAFEQFEHSGPRISFPSGAKHRGTACGTDPETAPDRATQQAVKHKSKKKASEHLRFARCHQSNYSASSDTFDCRERNGNGFFRVDRIQTKQ